MLAAKALTFPKTSIASTNKCTGNLNPVTNSQVHKTSYMGKLNRQQTTCTSSRLLPESRTSIVFRSIAGNGFRCRDTKIDSCSCNSKFVQ